MNYFTVFEKSVVCVPLVHRGGKKKKEKIFTKEYDTKKRERKRKGRRKGGRRKDKICVALCLYNWMAKKKTEIKRK